MTSPRYARATTSSSLKASPKAVTAIDVSSTNAHARKFKRPSLLTAAERSRILYTRDLFPIKPRHKSQSCHLASLPSELRMEIYQYVLFDEVLRFPEVVLDGQKWRHEPKYIWPAMLHICRGIRIEAAYAYYTNAPFSWHIRNLDFSPVMKWANMLPREHRALLVRNQKIKIDVLPSFVDDLTYPPPGYLIDDYEEAHWRRCEPFGNLYSLNTIYHRKHFIAFCRLATWWSWCSKPVYTHIRWNYMFGDGYMVGWSYRSGVGTERQLNRFMRAAVSAIAMPCVMRAWTRNDRRTDMKSKAVEWVNALDHWWGKRTNAALRDEQVEWLHRIDMIRHAISLW